MAKNGSDNGSKKPQNGREALANTNAKLTKMLYVTIGALSAVVAVLLIAVCVLAFGKSERVPVISVIDGYIAVDGVKTEYEAELSCDHDWQTETVAPTCTEKGYDIKTCSVCEKRVRLNETAPKSHFFGSYITDGEYHRLECTVCGEVKGKAMHSPGEDGSCSVCALPLSDTPGIIYEVSDDGTYAIAVGYSGESAKVKIASEYNGVPVRVIYRNAFEKANIDSVIIPDSVTDIGSGAFRYCYNLASVVIGSGVETIGEKAFELCSALASIKIPDGVTSIGAGAFENCDSLSSIVLPEGVTSIEEFTFYNCSALASIKISDSVKSIGDNAFELCNPSLYTEYEFGSYVRSGDNPYAVLIEITNKNMSSYKINENTKHIACHAFYNCSRLSSITVPDGVISIGESAFGDCTGLTSIEIPNGTRSIGDSAFSCCTGLTAITLPDSVTSIGYGAFWGCTNLTSIEIPDGVKSIENYTFYDCTHLVSIEIPDGVRSIGNNAFENCLQLSSVVIPDSVTSIGSYAFAWCLELSTIVIGRGVRSVGQDVFIGYVDIRRIYYTGTSDEWAEISFAGGNGWVTDVLVNYKYVT